MLSPAIEETMHQHPRPPPVTASPANSPRTNPARTNNPREQDLGKSRVSSERSTSTEQGIGMGEGSDALIRGQEATGQSRDSVAKLSQIVQVRCRNLAHCFVPER